MIAEIIMHTFFGAIGLGLTIFLSIWIKRNKEWTDWIGYVLLGLGISHTLLNIISLILLLT